MRPLPKLLLASALAGVLVLPWMKREAEVSAPADEASPAAIVSVAPAVSTAFAPHQWSPGSVISRRDARVAGEQTGRVVDVAERDLPARLGRHLGDSGSHESRTDDREPTRHIVLLRPRRPASP